MSLVKEVKRHEKAIQNLHELYKQLTDATMEELDELRKEISAHSLKIVEHISTIEEQEKQLDTLRARIKSLEAKS